MISYGHSQPELRRDPLTQSVGVSDRGEPADATEQKTGNTISGGTGSSRLRMWLSRYFPVWSGPENLVSGC